MVKSKENDISKISEGAVKGFLEWSEEKINSLIKKLKERKLAFIKDEETIKVVKEEFSSGEAKFYEKYIPDKNLLFLAKMGLVLRKIESNKEKLDNLRGKLFYKFKQEGLHTAEFVQNGMLSRYIGILIDRVPSIEELTNEIVKVLKNIENHTIFVQTQDTPQKIVDTILTKIRAHSPSIFIISGISPADEIIKKMFRRA